MDIVNDDFADHDFVDNDADVDVDQENEEQDVGDQGNLNQEELDVAEHDDEEDLLDQIRIDSVNREIHSTSNEFRDLPRLTYRVSSDPNTVRSETGVDFNQLDDEDMYENPNHGSLKDLKINLGTNELPRFSCAAHKMNIAVRRAITAHKPLSKILKKLSKFSAKIKHSINLSKVYLENKCCLRCENATRWSSSFLMLLSYVKAYHAGAFEVENREKCPYSLETIELYFQILQPVYVFSLFVQKSSVSICEMLQALILLINNYVGRLALTGEGTLIFNFFIKSIHL